MAKVTLTLEDVERDGVATIRMSVDSDNKNSDEYTIAETIAEQLYSIVLSQADSIRNVTIPGKPEDSPLN